jgi:DNA-binding LacI/PurR family transcriptional regulator
MMCAEARVRPSVTKRRATIIDVARQAGTSKSTVSNVIHGRDYVRPETRDRVLDAMRELDYHVNAAARALVRQRTDVLGVVVGSLENPFHAEIASRIEREARSQGHAMLLASTGGDVEGEGPVISSLIEHRVDAILFVSFSGSPATLASIPSEVPFVFVTLRDPRAPSVSVDDQAGAEAAVRHLLELGHRRIAYVSTTLSGEPVPDAARFRGYERALRNAPDRSGDFEVALRVDGLTSDRARESAAAAIRDLLEADPSPTGIFAASDLTALEVLSCAQDLGLSVPADLSVVGFDDIAIARLARIPLTTVASPVAEIAKRATRSAISLAAGQALDELREPEVLLEPTLVVRGSTAPPRP